MKRKFLSTIVCLTIILFAFLLLPTQAQAASDSDLTFTLNDDGKSYSVTDCSPSASGSLTIPATYNGKPVSTIGGSAFSGCSSLTSITIPDSVTYIGYGAFSGCSSLESLTIPFVGSSPKTSSDTDQYPFGYIFGTSGYTSSTAVKQYYYGSSTSSTTSSTYYIPKSLKSVTVTGGNILYGAFYNCSTLTSITIPGSVTSIGDFAFSDCSSLTSITIPDSVTYIGYDAFFGCSSLTSITIPDSVTSISGSAFSGCSSLTSITIPDSVTSIGYFAFYYCISLTGITIPDSVTSIGDYAFFRCSSLTSITIPDSVTSIGSSAFSDCSSLSHVAYTGTQSQWNQISIESYNNNLTDATRHYETSFRNVDNCVESGVYCPVCESFIFRTEKENGAHTYGDWIVTNPASFAAEGLQQKTCIHCGGEPITQTIPKLIGMVDQWNVALNNDLKVNFYLNISECIESTARVRIHVGEEGYTYRVSTLQKSEDGLYVASVNVAAAQMSDYIFVTVLNGNDIGTTMSYTVRQYADTILADENYSLYHSLIKEMLNYGAAAQIYFDHEADNLANSGITGTSTAEIPSTVDSEITLTGKANGITFYGASLIFREKIAIRYYFNFVGAIKECCFTINGISYSPALNDGLFYIEMNDILPQDLDQSITLTVTDADGNELKVDYSPMNYIVRMNEKGCEELKNLLKALYNYHLAAKELSQSAA